MNYQMTLQQTQVITEKLITSVMTVRGMFDATKVKTLRTSVCYNGSKGQNAGLGSIVEYSRSRRTRTILARGFRAFLCDKSQGDPARVQVQKRNLKRDPRISPQNPERSEKLGEPRQALRDKRDLERSMESREIAGKPRNCRRSTEFREIPRIRRSFDRDPSRSSNSSRKSSKKCWNAHFEQKKLDLCPDNFGI
ncbi:hypothetical protein K0M31_018627 [Melipona bicolor]|uniref:Uncharacterized protein n=1 Tax=Melipona bicolor TaxID=60889 RepID=A0AA40KRV7_9HYME|nr:hypothetical protein K0M31_018627 [Melipona bicolor]